jgi:hypothetical protein
LERKFEEKRKAEEEEEEEEEYDREAEYEKASKFAREAHEKHKTQSKLVYDVAWDTYQNMEAEGTLDKDLKEIYETTEKMGQNIEEWKVQLEGESERLNALTRVTAYNINPITAPQYQAMQRQLNSFQAMKNPLFTVDDLSQFLLGHPLTDEDKEHPSDALDTILHSLFIPANVPPSDYRHLEMAMYVGLGRTTTAPGRMMSLNINAMEQGEIHQLQDTVFQYIDTIKAGLLKQFNATQQRILQNLTNFWLWLESRDRYLNYSKQNK